MAKTDCIFCRIVAGESASNTVYQDDRVTAFRDIRPVAPTHILIVPNRHITSINDVTPEDEPYISTQLKTGLFGVTKETIRKARRVVIAYSQFRLSPDNQHRSQRRAGCISPSHPLDRGATHAPSHGLMSA